MTTKGKDLKPHIGIFGRRNSGKSSFINAMVGHDVSIVSDQAGTTTDPVKKSVEIFGIGPTIMIDTAGIDDHGALGEQRIKKTMESIKQIDCAILIITENRFGDHEIFLTEQFKKNAIPYLIIHNKSDLYPVTKTLLKKVADRTQQDVLEFSAKDKRNFSQIIEGIKQTIPQTAFVKPSLFKGLIQPKDPVLLITPIDSEAPEGRMILPQVMAWRDILDHDALCFSVKETELKDFLKLGLKPALAVTDSQVFSFVAEILPDTIPLTSFSILFARLKGHFKQYLEGTPSISRLKDHDKVLLLESCTHHVSCDDIGRFKIPRWLKAFTGKKLEFDVVPGLSEIAKPIEQYALVIQCGGCVATQKQVQNRLNDFIEKKIPVTNYGLTIAYINGIFDRAVKPFLNN
jgi:[FeFe] hydrogenase H-cluster maturation GTPase HydF